MHVMLRCNHRCNFNCVYCFQKETNRSRAFIDHGKLDIIFRKIRNYMNRYGGKNELIEFEWTGGEPLLLGHEYFEKAFSLQRKRLRNYIGMLDNNIMTNGSCLDEDYLELFNKYSVTFGVSMDVVGATRLRGTEDTSMDIHEKIKMLLKRGQRFGSIVVVTKKNVAQLKGIYRLMSEMDIGFHFNHLKRMGFEYEDDLVPTVDELVKHVMDVIREYVKDQERGKYNRCITDLTYLLNLALYGHSKITLCDGGYCFQKFVSIEPDGSCYPCPTFSNEHTYMGNIYEQSLGSIMRHPLRRLIGVRRAKLFNEECADCELKEGCRGGCVAGAYYEGAALKRNQSQCDYIRKIVPKIRRFMANRSLKWLEEHNKSILGN